MRGDASKRDIGAPWQGSAIQAVPMTHPIWPLFDLQVRTPVLELRYIDDALATELAQLAARGIHDLTSCHSRFRGRTSPHRDSSVLRCSGIGRLAETSAAHWHLTLAAIVDGIAIGMTKPRRRPFCDVARVRERLVARSRTPRTRLGQGDARGHVASRLRGARSRCATTGAWQDNGPSLGVTRSLGYSTQGSRRAVRRGEAPSRCDSGWRRRLAATAARTTSRYTAWHLRCRSRIVIYSSAFTVSRAGRRSRAAAGCRPVVERRCRTLLAECAAGRAGCNSAVVIARTMSGFLPMAATTSRAKPYQLVGVWLVTWYTPLRRSRRCAGSSVPDPR